MTLAELGAWVAPCVMTVCAGMMLFSKKDYAGVFLDGAKDGIKSAFTLLPSLIFLLPAVKMLSASGLWTLLGKCFAGLLSWLGLPSETLGVLFARPLSFGAANGLLHELHLHFGADSFASCFAGVYFATADTAVYMISCYMSAAGIKNSRRCLPAALVTSAAAMGISYCLVKRLL